MTDYAHEAAIEYEKTHRLRLFELRDALNSASYAARESVGVENALGSEKSSQEVKEILDGVEALKKKIEEKINRDAVRADGRRSELSPYA